jgi:adenine/guanine/hypoxanthine permease
MADTGAPQGGFSGFLDRRFGLTAIAMPLTFSIATGIGLGFITYALCKLLAGRMADAKPAVLVLAVLFAVKFAVSN